MTKKIAVVLSGSGVFDGSEIHEAVMTLLAIQQQGASYQCFAPNIPQHHVINHISGEEMNEQRNVLIESARIARGDIKDLADYRPDDYDALFFPGGFGAAKNLSTVAFDGPNCNVNPTVSQAVLSTHKAQKPIGALCISPAMIAKVLSGVTVTIGQDKGTAEAIEAMGSHHEVTDHGGVSIDQANKVVTSPCYMLDANIGQIFDGAQNAVKAVLALA